MINIRKGIFSLALAGLLASTLAAQTPTAPPVAERDLRQHVQHLAADDMEGRRTGEKGSIAASGYIANVFAKNRIKGGVVDAAGKRGYLQQFPFVTGVELAADGNSVAIEFTDDKGHRSKIGEDDRVRPTGFSANGEAANAPIVFAGYGISSEELKYDDYNGVDAKGKVVLVFDGNPENEDPHSRFGRFDARTKALIAKDKGAVGVIIVSRQDKFEDEKLHEMRYDQALGEAALPVFAASRKTAAHLLGVSETELKTVEGLTAMKKNSSVKINIGFRDTQPSISFAVKLVKKQADAYNVVGIIEGRDPVLKNEAIVIGAHYDHLGFGGQGSLAVNSSEIHHGADDNASGTAALLTLASRFAKERRNKRTIILVAFSGEEEGLIGSKYYVNNPVMPIEKTVAMINMDMVGRLNENKLTVGGIGSAEGFKALVESINDTNHISVGEDALIKEKIAAALLPLKVNAVSVLVKNGKAVVRGSVPSRKYADVVKAINESGVVVWDNQMEKGNRPAAAGYRGEPFNVQLNQDGFGPSDHASFYGKKIPVLFLFTGTHVDYHKPSDTADKINYEGLLRITDYVQQLVRAIDTDTARPVYTVAPSSGTMGGGRGFSVSLGTVPSYGDSTDGMILDGVRDNSPAAKAGLQAGDKVVKLAGKDVRNVMDYTYVLGEMKAGQEYEVVVKRGAETLTLKIVPAAPGRRQ